jgi:MFS superfamily sulfate permease-like transporter
MVGMGAANVAAGLFQGFAVSTSRSRTAVAEQSGAKSQVTGVVGAGLVALLLLFLNSLLADLPQAALAAVVIVAATSLMDVGILQRYYEVRRSALAISLVATIGVILLGVLQGINVAVGLAILLFFAATGGPTAQSSAPATAPRSGTASTTIPAPGRSAGWSSTDGKRRCSLPTPGSSAGKSAGWCASAIWHGSCCNARPSPTST